MSLYRLEVRAVVYIEADGPKDAIEEANTDSLWEGGGYLNRVDGIAICVDRSVGDYEVLDVRTALEGSSLAVA